MKNPFTIGRRGFGFDDDSYDRGFYRDGKDGTVDDYDDDEGERELLPSAVGGTAAQKPAAGGNGLLKVVKPRESDDCRAIADFLIQGYQVIMDIEDLEREEMTRLIIFLQGVLHVLDGELRKVSKTTVVLSPRKGEVSDAKGLLGERRTGEI